MAFETIGDIFKALVDGNKICWNETAHLNKEYVCLSNGKLVNEEGKEITCPAFVLPSRWSYYIEKVRFINLHELAEIPSSQLVLGSSQVAIYNPKGKYMGCLKYSDLGRELDSIDKANFCSQEFFKLITREVKV